MTTTPAELYAIKRAAAEALASLGTTSEQDLAVLDAIDAGAAAAAQRRVLMYDADTGEELMPTEAAAHPARLLIGASQFPGWPAEEIDAAYSAWMQDDPDPRPFGIGKVVTHRELESMRGRVVSRNENGGELHTVGVDWGHGTGAELYSPRELVEVPA